MTYALTEDRVAYRTSAQAVNNDGRLDALGVFDCPAGLAAGQAAAASGGDPQCAPTYVAWRAAVDAHGPDPAAWPPAAVQALRDAFAQMRASPRYYGNPAEHIVGAGPAAWLGDRFADSRAAGIPFQVPRPPGRGVLLSQRAAAGGSGARCELRGAGRRHTRLVTGTTGRALGGGSAA